LSTLTKVLIVLLTIASIFLCGIVVTYVASADNFKEKYDSLSRRYQAAEKTKEAAETQLNAKETLWDEEKLKLGGEKNALQQEVDTLKAQVAQITIEKDNALRQVSGWATITKDFSATNALQRQMMSDAIANAKKLEAEQTKQNKELNDTTDALMERMAVITTLQQQLKDLLEEKTVLQSKLDQFLRQYGKVIAPPSPVTALREKVRVAPDTKNIDLKGSISSVNLKNSLAEISIGQADGVKEGMRFHATRSDKFICDIVILDVEPEKAVGWLELLPKQPQFQPKAGDSVATNL
jgi:hypothetical protein